MRRFFALYLPLFHNRWPLFSMPGQINPFNSKTTYFNMFLSFMTSSPNWSFPSALHTNAFMSPRIYYNPTVSNLPSYHYRKMCQEALYFPDKI